MTRQQQYLVNAVEHVAEVQKLNDRKLSTAYGGLCHSIPMLVLNDGLAQAIAWIVEKSAGGSEANAALTRAYALQAKHIAHLFGISPTANVSGSLIERVREASNTRYMHDTQALLDAWVYYKRFAASLLGVAHPTADALEEGAGA